MDSDTDKHRVGTDGIRIFEKSGHRRVARARVVVAVLVTAVVAVVVLSTAAVLFLRRERATETAAVASLRAVEKLPVATTPPRAPARSRPPRNPSAAHIAHVDQAEKPAPPAAIPDTVMVPGNDPPRSAAAMEKEKRVESLARDVIEGLKASGETGGLAAFPPPGTDPIKTGLVVPEDFELPKGYVRHYQTTDDGTRLEPILMFSPDYKFVDRNGQPVTLPEDGIVPPDMAPPGLPLRTLQLPKGPRTARDGTR